MRPCQGTLSSSNPQNMENVIHLRCVCTSWYRPTRITIHSMTQAGNNNCDHSVPCLGHWICVLFPLLTARAATVCTGRKLSLFLLLQLAVCSAAHLLHPTPRVAPQPVSGSPGSSARIRLRLLQHRRPQSQAAGHRNSSEFLIDSVCQPVTRSADT